MACSGLGTDLDRCRCCEQLGNWGLALVGHLGWLCCSGLITRFPSALMRAGSAGTWLALPRKFGGGGCAAGAIWRRRTKARSSSGSHWERSEPRILSLCCC